MYRLIEIDLGGIPLKIETHRWAKLSNGSALVSYKDNRILVTANMKDEAKEDMDFFPLMVDYRESNYAAGKIPGGFFKREGKPSEREVLLSRLIDRPVRPMFPDGFANETQVIANLLSADFSVDFDSLGIIGASAALLSSTIPFTTPLGAVKLGWKEGEFFLNPAPDRHAEMKMILQMAGTATDVVMIEAGGHEFSEELFREGLALGKEWIAKICRAQEALINPDKLEVRPDPLLQEILQGFRERHTQSLRQAIFTPSKKERLEKVSAVSKAALAEIADEKLLPKAKNAFHRLESEVFRTFLLEDGRRNDGRASDEIRPISIELGVLPRAHGSAVFTRGETQALATVTLGSEDDAQRIDSLAATGELKRFMLHYNFPPYSVGEVSFLRGTGRREVGHGNLAEKALRPMLPDEADFPYTIRVVSDILESNGSSSQASVCGGTLALMNAGVPVKAPVAGIAMGLVKEGDRFMVLTDIAGYEDHFGDMDFKIAGTTEGITAVQLDIKMDGLNDAVIERTLADARQGRLFILSKMKEAIPAPSEKVSEYAPVILNIKIKQDKIRDLIGPGGKNIKELVLTFNSKINTDDFGNVTVAAPNMEIGQRVIRRIEEITATPEVGRIYKGKAVRIEDYGIFVEIVPGTLGLLHISESSKKRLKTIHEAGYQLGDEVEVKVVGVDRDNKVRLSRRDLD